MIAQVGTMSLAVNELVTANHAVFTSLSQKRDEYIQARDRLDRLGQTRPVTFWNVVVPGTVDEVILQSHRDRTDLEQAILGTFWGTTYDNVTSLVIQSNYTKLLYQEEHMTAPPTQSKVLVRALRAVHKFSDTKTFSDLSEGSGSTTAARLSRSPRPHATWSGPLRSRGSRAGQRRGRLTSTRVRSPA